MSSARKLTLVSGFRRVAVAAVALLLICAVGAADKPAPAAQAARVEGDRIITPDGWFARAKVERPPLPKEITVAFVIPIHGAIGTSTYEAVKRKIIRCKTAGAQIIIFDMNTPGGRSDAMGKIIRLIMKELKEVYTVAYVNPDALSAGALISVACDEIVMSPDARIGAAMGILVGPQGIQEIPEKVRGKFESADLAGARIMAKRNGYDKDLIEGMITIDRVIWLIRHKRTRELQVVNASEWYGKVADVPPGKRLKEGLVEPADAQWQYVRTIAGPNKLVTLIADEALSYGLSRHIADSVEALNKTFNITVEPTVLTDNWSEDLVTFLTSPVVMSILMFVGILAIYAELHSPGFGAPGAVAIVCFAIVFGSHYLVGLAQWWEIALFFVGVLLLLVELLLIPGFGVAGIAGILCCVAALLAMLIPNAPMELPWPDTEGAWEMFETGALWMMGAFVAATVAGAVLARFLPRVPIASRLVLAAPEGSLTAPTTEDAPILDIRPGQVGKVTQTCRPVGKVSIGGRLVDAIADGAFIEAGAEVVVLRNEGNRVVIEAKA